MVIDCFQLSKRKGLLKKNSKLKVGPKKIRPLRGHRVKGSLLRVKHFMQSSKHVRQAMGLYFVSLASLVKPHDTEDPNFEITTHSLRYKKNGKT